MDKEQQKEIKRCERLRLKAQEANNLREESEWCNALGNLYLQAGDHDEALNMHKQELALCRSLQDVVGEAVANRKIGDVYLSMEKYDLAISHHKKHLDLADGDIVELQRANTSLGQTYLEQARSLTSPKEITEALKKSIRLLTQSVELTSELKENEKVSTKEYHEMKIRSYINLGLCHHQLSLAVFDDEKKAASKQCSEFFQNAIYLAEKCSASEELYLANRIMCDINIEQRQVTSALRNAEAALKIAKASGNKQKLFESLNLCAQIYLYMENIESARSCLKKSFRMKGQPGLDLIEEKLKSVLKIQKIKQEIANKLDDVDQLFKLHEAMADLFCKLDCYLLAVKHYKKQEELLDKLSLCTPRHRATVYFSIATTLMDAGEYPEAIQYFERELTNNQDKAEHAKTFTHVANCCEKMKEPYEEVKGHYDKALECAREAGNGHLELQTLTSLEKTQLNYDMRIDASETGTKIAALEAKWGLFADDLDEETLDTCQNSCPLDDSEELLRAEMERVSDDDSDREDGSRKRRKTTFARKNEKGETPLHRACIEGHVTRAKLLIEQGHPINPRDFCEWTPLHEASNHGHQEIVVLLLSNGANVNAIGGQQCDAITPIQDAALNGHFAIVSMLLEKGADPNIPDARGRITLDTLAAYYQSHKEDLSPSTKKEYKHLYATLKQRSGDKKNSSVLIQNNINDNFATDLLTLAQDDYPDSTAPSSVDPDEHHELPDLTQREFRRKRGSFSDYKDSIAALGSASTLPVTQTQRSVKRAGPASSLMRDDEPDVDDWLVDDVDDDDDAPFRQPTKKPRRLEVTKRAEPASAAKRGWKRKSTKITEFCRKPSTQIESAFVPVDLTADDEFEPASAVGPLPYLPSQPPLPEVDPPDVALRVKVVVREATFVVSIPKGNKSVSWLEERAASLYENMTKLRPNLTLFTGDGARLLPADQLCDVIRNNDIIQAREDALNALPFSQRYVEMCQNSGLLPVPRIVTACQECESSAILEIRNYGFDFECLNPMLATLRQAEVTRVLLPGNGLSDDGVECLCAALSRTVTSQSGEAGLRDLNLACNDVTAVGLLNMSKCPVLKNLTALNLSFNPLQGGENLAKLLTTIKCLKNLNVSHCYLTEEMFEIPDAEKTLHKALRHVRQLDISGNYFGSECVGKWLDALNRDAVDSLNLSSVADQENNHNLAIQVEKFLRKCDGRVTSIDITCNDLQSKHISGLRSCLHLMGTLYISK